VRWHTLDPTLGIRDFPIMTHLFLRG
jgi:hypothetical protein